MSEYWKSTERYWCKYCTTYVKDTKLERQNHDNSPRHQGQLKRFVRDLHRTNEKAARETQRARDEVARLNGAVGGVAASGSVRAAGAAVNGDGGGRGGVYARPTAGVASTASGGRTAQLQQLVDLGVAIPDEFRRELSMTGEWQTVSERILPAEGVDEEKKMEGIGFGVRKRENRDDDGEEEVDEEDAREVKRKRWEARARAHRGEADKDLDALLNGNLLVKKKEDIAEKNVKTESDPTIPTGVDLAGPTNGDAAAAIPTIKHEPSDARSPLADLPTVTDPSIKAEDALELGIVFKKRAKKNIRQKG